MDKKTFKWKSIVFDCDGVILNSNKLKTNAFREIALPFGSGEADALVKFHTENGGMSRYAKFEHFVNEIVQENCRRTIRTDELIKEFAEKSRSGLQACEICGGLAQLRESTANTRWLVVSGGDQEELRAVFKTRRLERYFDGGIFGSPDRKSEILAREIENGNIVLPAVYLGDSKLDYEVAVEHKLDFMFVFQWTEFSGWHKFFEKRNVQIILEPIVLEKYL